MTLSLVLSTASPRGYALKNVGGLGMGTALDSVREPCELVPELCRPAVLPLSSVGSCLLLRLCFLCSILCLQTRDGFLKSRIRDWKPRCC